MPSRSTRYRHAFGDRINATGVLAMVACSYCSKKGLGCRLSSLSERCGNCVRNGNYDCSPAEVPLPDFSRLDREMAKLETAEEETEAQLEADEAAAEAVLVRMREARNKLKRLRKQKKLLKKKEQKMFDQGLETAEELERLEALEGLNQDLASTNPEAPVGAEVIDWSVFWNLDEVPSGSPGGIVAEASRNS